MPTLNKDERFTEVGGRMPLRYLQDGNGFDSDGNYLGRFDEQGVQVEEKPRRRGRPRKTVDAVETSTEPAEPKSDELS